MERRTPHQQQQQQCPYSREGLRGGSAEGAAASSSSPSSLVTRPAVAADPAPSDPAAAHSRKRKGNSAQTKQPYPEPHAMNMQAAAAAGGQAQAAAAAAYTRDAAAQHAEDLARWRQQNMVAASSSSAASTEPTSASPSASSQALSFASSASTSPAHTFDQAWLTLGIETADDSMCTVIPRGTKLPCTSAQLFSTYADQQPGVSILVYQGQRASTRDNQFLGRLDLLGIRPAPRGVPRIEVTFTLDVYGSLRVTAHESLQHGTVQALTVQEQFDAPSKHWQPDIVQELLKDAELHRKEDEQLIARIAAKSRLEQFTYGLRTSLEQHTWRSMLTPDEAQTIRQQHELTVQWLGERENRSVRPEEYERKLEEIQTVCQPIVMKMYTVAIAGQAPALTSEPSESVMASVMPPGHPSRNSAESAPSVSAAFASPEGFIDGHRTPPPPVVQSGTHASPESAYRYSSSLPLPSLAASNSSPLHSPMAPPTISSSWNAVPHWTHPSLLTSPILSSANHHSSEWSNGGPVVGGGSNQTQAASAAAAGGITSNMEESYMDFLTFPNSATLSLTNVTLTDAESAAIASRESDTRLLQPHDLESTSAAGAMPSGSAAHLMRPVHAEPMRMFHQQQQNGLRLRGGSYERSPDPASYSSPSSSSPPPQR